jgi:hypothetical protein
MIEIPLRMYLIDVKVTEYMVKMISGGYFSMANVPKPYTFKHNQLTFGGIWGVKT